MNNLIKNKWINLKIIFLTKLNINYDFTNNKKIIKIRDNRQLNNEFDHFFLLILWSDLHTPKSGSVKQRHYLT